MASVNASTRPSWAADGSVASYKKSFPRKTCLVPSRSEPCGLTQLYALKYGTLPLVRRTGGLADTVIDANPAASADGSATGFQFVNATGQELVWALRRAMGVYRKPERWHAMQRRAMTRDFGWHGPAEEYMELYRGIVGR